MADSSPSTTTPTDSDAASRADKQRIAQLEQEVTRLREQLGDSASAECAEDAKLDAQLGRKATKLRVVLIAVVLVALTLGVMYSVFQALSAGFNSAAKKAADVLVGEPEQPASGTTRPAPKKRRSAPTPDTPRVPGL